MKKNTGILRFMVAALGLLTTLSAFATHWDNISITPADGWDNYAVENQPCGGYYGGRQCAPGLQCDSTYSHSGNGPICRRSCYSSYDCSSGQQCVSNGYSGICVYDGEGGSWNPQPYPNYPTPSYPEADGYCGRNGYHCPRNAVCRDYDRDGAGACYAMCRSSQDCTYGQYCAQGACAPNRDGRWRR
jgi:hypothetical protein